MSGGNVLEVAVEGEVQLLQRNGQPLAATAVPAGATGVQSITANAPLVQSGSASDVVLDLPSATSSAAGAMSAADKVKLTNLPSNPLVSPLTAPLDAGDQAVSDLKTVSLDAVLALGSVSGNVAINWSSAQWQRLTLGGNTTFSFTAPPGPNTCKLFMVAGSGAPTFPASVIWVGNVVPTWSTTPGLVDVVSLAWDGSTYYASAGTGWPR